MSEYMSFERMRAIAKEVNALFKISNHYDDSLMRDKCSKDYTSVHVVGADGNLRYPYAKDVSSGWIQSDWISGRYVYYKNIRYHDSLWYGDTSGFVDITDAEIKKGLAILQARERKPIFVGTRRVSGLWVKQGQQLVKPSGVYVKQGGAIKKL